MVTVYTFGDSILDCGHYNPHGVTPGGLLVRNNDRLFPEFRGRDLSALGEARLVHRAEDGGTVASIPGQIRGVTFAPDAVVLLTVGGNDLLEGILTGVTEGLARFAGALEAFLRALPVEGVLIGNVYDPTLGDDRRNFIPVPPALARDAHARMNALIAEAASRHGHLVDLAGHFLRHGDPSWFTNVIEPSLQGASEVRRCFLAALRPDMVPPGPA